MLNKIKIEILLLICALAWVILSYCFSPVTEVEIWFSRSGSIMVLLAVIVEYRLTILQNNKINKAIRTSIISSVPFKSKLSQEHDLIYKIAHVFVVLGTLIWGYGDLLK